MFRPLLRPMLAALAIAFALGAAPATAASLAQEAPKKGQTLAAAAAAKQPAWNRTVALNAKTKVFHVKGCRHFDGKGGTMTLKAAKAGGGKACKVCIPAS